MSIKWFEQHLLVGLPNEGLFDVLALDFLGGHFHPARVQILGLLGAEYAVRVQQE